jgi:predicted Na+-dependent transporter
LFVVTSMLAMGMSLTIAQIVEPLGNVRLVVLALVAVWTIRLGGSNSRIVPLSTKGLMFLLGHGRTPCSTPNGGMHGLKAD